MSGRTPSLSLSTSHGLSISYSLWSSGICTTQGWAHSPTCPVLFLEARLRGISHSQIGKKPTFSQLLPSQALSLREKLAHPQQQRVGLWLIAHGSHQAQEGCGCVSMGLSAPAWKDQLEHFQSLPVFSAPALLAHPV